MENTTKKTQGEYTVDIVHVLKSIWHRMWLIVLVGLLAAGAAFGYARFIKAPQYSSSVRLMVKNSTKAEATDNNIKYDLSLTASELSAAQSLVKTYMRVLEGHDTMDQVIKTVEERYQTDLPYSPEQLAGMIEVEAVDETEILKIKVTTGDPYEASAIADCISIVLPLRVVDDLELKPLQVVDKAYVDLNKVSPNVTKTTIEGFVIGMLLAVLVVVVLAIIDGSIHDEEYILRTYNYPVLARIPSLNQTVQKDGNYTNVKKE
ncbi:MAG: hypothetical protein IKC59_00350 [Clostridia bacterium]|nr:hypothetical protein [Clostridia bacterium]